MNWLLAMLLLVGWLAVPAAALAEPTRYALVIGANRGLADEVTLHFAEQDAVKVAKVLTQLADVPEENLLLLQGSSADRVRAVLAELAARTKRLRADQPDARPLLLVYYSGHSSASALHLGSSVLPFQELREKVQAVGADVAVFVVDSCRSGGLTRSKGGRHAPAFTITVENHLLAKGTAVIASAAEDEDAQESDRLGGGIFTTHFLGGLRGAADANTDRRVTLSEAYEYAYRETLSSTSRTRSLQHPTFSFKLEGRHDLTLTRTDDPRSQAVLQFGAAGRYVLLDESRGGGVSAEFKVDRPTDVLVPVGGYLVRYLGARSVREARIALLEGQRTALQLSAMDEMPYGNTVRRGLVQRSAVSVGLEAGAGLAMLEGFSPGLSGAVGAAVDLTGARLQARLRYGWAVLQNTDVTAVQQMLGGDLTALHVFDLDRIGIGIGARVGVDRFSQQFQTSGIAPPRSVWAPLAAPVLRVEAAPWPRWLASLECGVDVHAVQVDSGRGARWTTPAAPFCTVGGSFYLP